MTKPCYAGVTVDWAFLTDAPLQPAGAGQGAWGLLALSPAFQPCEFPKATCEFPQATLVRCASGWFCQVSKERSAAGRRTAA